MPEPQNLVAVLRDNGELPVAQLPEFRDVGRGKTGQEITALVKAGVLERTGRAPSRGGRPSNLVGLSERVRYVGIDIGVSSISVGVTDGYLKVLAFAEQPADVRSGPEAVLSQAIAMTRSLCDQPDGPIDAVGIGVGLPGPVRFCEGRPVVPPLMPGWDDYPVRDRLSTELGVPVTVDNDVNIMALGELHAGAARGVADFLFIKLGTGIGCGIVVDGTLYRGQAGAAGDIGHIGVGLSNVLCHCGRTGCLEAQFGGSALAQSAAVAAQSGESPMLAQRLREHGVLSAADVSWASTAGDPAANRMIRTGGQLLGQVLAGLINFFNPAMVVVGGGLSQLGPILLAEIRSVILDRSTPLATNELSVVMTGQAEHGGVIGAARLASQTFIDSLADPSFELATR